MTVKRKFFVQAEFHTALATPTRIVIAGSTDKIGI
jgi:hypothetical protein